MSNKNLLNFTKFKIKEIARTDESENAFLQFLQRYGLSPLCVLWKNLIIINNYQKNRDIKVTSYVLLHLSFEKIVYHI